jgi:hypothetical protein
MATKKSTTPAATGTAAPILSGNVPQQISYSGQNFIELQLPAGAFLAGASTTGGQR